MTNFIKRKYSNLVSDSRFSEILSGSIWALSARMCTMFLAFVFNVVVARSYGPQVLGIVAILNSFLMFATLFTVMGTHTSVLRLIPEHMAKYSPTSAFKVYRKTQFIVISASIAVSAFLFLFARLLADEVFSKPHLSSYFAIASVFIVFQSILSINTQAVRGLRLIRLFALMQVLPQSFNLLFLFFVTHLWASNDVPVYTFLSSITMTGIIGWIIMEYMLKRKMKPEDKIQFTKIRTIVSISFPMFMAGTMAVLIGESGVFLLGMLRTEAEVGYYAMVVKLAGLTTFVLYAIDSMAGPKFSELFHLNKLDDLFHVAKKSAKFIFILTTPLFIFLIIFGKQFLSIAFGKEFSAGYLSLVFLMIGQFINSISGSTGMFMNMTGNEKVLRNFMVVGGILNIIISLLLIPYWGINGAAIAAMVSLGFWNISSLVYIKRKFGKTTGYFPMLKFFNNFD